MRTKKKSAGFLNSRYALFLDKIAISSVVMDPKLETRKYGNEAR